MNKPKTPKKVSTSKKTAAPKGLDKYAMKPGSLTEISSTFERMRFADSRREYSALVAGEVGAPTVAVFHGVTGNKFDMSALVAELVSAGRRVVAFDLPGHGEASKELFDQFDELGQWMASALKASGEDFEVIMSNSFGSGITYNYLSQGLLQDNMRVVLGCPTPKIAAKAYVLNYLGNLVSEELANDVYSSELLIKVRVETLQQKKGRQYKNWMFESEYYKTSWISAKATTNMTELFLQEKPYSAVLAESVQKRVTVLAGDRDNAVTKDAMKYLRELMPNSEFRTAPGAGHLLHFEAISEVVSAVVSASRL